MKQIFEIEYSVADAPLLTGNDVAEALHAYLPGVDLNVSQLPRERQLQPGPQPESPRPTVPRNVHEVSRRVRELFLDQTMIVRTSRPRDFLDVRLEAQITRLKHLDSTYFALKRFARVEDVASRDDRITGLLIFLELSLREGSKIARALADIVHLADSIGEGWDPRRPPDWQVASRALREAGESLDAVSHFCMMRALEGARALALEALGE